MSVVAMARQSLLFKACSLFNSNAKFAYNNGIPQVNLLVPNMGLKTKAPIESEKIPQKPKKPLTSYFRYIIEMRPTIIKENPSLDNKGIIKTLGERWRSLAPEIKAKYDDEVLKDKQRYDQEILSYNAKLTPEQEKIIEKMKANKKLDNKKRRVREESIEQGKPKRPLNSFTLFVKENPTGEKSMIGNLRMLKDKWAELSEVEKEKFRMISKRNMEQYEVELAKWEAQMIQEGKSHLARVKTLHALKAKDE